MPSSPNKGYTQPTYNSEVGSWGTDVNANLTGIVDLNLGGLAAVSLSSTNVTLTTGATGQMQNLIVALTGTLLASVTVSSAAVGFYLVENRTTGAFTVTWAANFGGGTVGTAWVIPQGYSGLFFSDTTYGARCLNWAPLILAAASGATPAILRRTENDTTARKALSIQSGLGSGNDYSIYETGDAANNVATVTEQIGTTVIGTKTTAAHGFPIPLDLTEIATPSAPASGALRFYSKSGDTLAIQGSGGVERVVGITMASVQGLVVTNDGSIPNTKIDVTATQAILTDSSGFPVRATNVSVVINLSVNGANGLDAGSLASSTWYYVYLISNGTITAGLASTSATTPTLPAGYIYSMRVGAMLTDGSGNLYRTKQSGRDAEYILTVATNTANPMAAASNVTTTGTAYSISGLIPPTATRIRGFASMNFNQNNAYMFVSPTSQYTVSGRYPAAMSTPGTFWGSNGSVPYDFLIEATSIYFQASNSGSLLVMGWQDAVNAC
jgi:hypothetical protein